MDNDFEVDEFHVDMYLVDGNALGLQVHGDLDTASANALLDAVESWPERVDTCVVDLANCEFLDSSGIRALLLCHRLLNGGHGTLRLVNVRSHIDRVLRIAGVQEIIQIDA